MFNHSPSVLTACIGQQLSAAENPMLLHLLSCTCFTVPPTLLLAAARHTLCAYCPCPLLPSCLCLVWLRCGTQKGFEGLNSISVSGQHGPLGGKARVMHCAVSQLCIVSYRVCMLIGCPRAYLGLPTHSMRLSYMLPATHQSLPHHAVACLLQRWSQFLFTQHTFSVGVLCWGLPSRRKGLQPNNDAALGVLTHTSELEVFYMHRGHTMCYAI